MPIERSAAEKVAEDYYDSRDADRFYELIWGGEDIHIGLYGEEGVSINSASHNTVVALANRLGALAKGARILDLGAGYGGAARYLATRYKCTVVCVNLSEVQNERNRRLNAERGLDRQIEVVHGSFEALPASLAPVDVIWSQDAFLHSARRHQVVSEIDRVLKPGGHVLFTDPMQADDCPRKVLQPVYERLSLDSLASPGWYRHEFTAMGFREAEWSDLTPELLRHYSAIRASIRLRYASLSKDISTAYLDRMLFGLNNWVNAANANHLRWGIFHFRKAPES